MAIALGQAGAKVAMNYFNNEERAEQALSEFEATGAEGAMIRANVTDEADVNRLVAEVGERLGLQQLRQRNLSRKNAFTLRTERATPQQD